MCIEELLIPSWEQVQRGVSWYHDTSWIVSVCAIVVMCAQDEPNRAVIVVDGNPLRLNHVDGFLFQDNTCIKQGPQVRVRNHGRWCCCILIRMENVISFPLQL